MSIKRTKQRSSGGKRKASGPAWSGGAKADDRARTWEEDVASQPDSEFVPYALTGHFPNDTLIAHATFGKGIVIKCEDTRIEVLFESGTKKLGQARSS